MSDALEMARCVEINLGNLVDIMPTLKLHPLLPIVQMQIQECIQALENVSGAGDDRLRKAAQDLIDYRKRSGPLNFQLEKADDFLREIQLALEGELSKPSDVGN